MHKLHHMIAVFAACATTAVAQIVTESEPNDTAFQANSIVCQNPIYGSLDVPGDHDWYRIILMAPKSLIIDTTTRNTKSQSGNPADPPSLTDSVVEVWNDDVSAMIGFNDDRVDEPSSVVAYMSRVSITLDAGTYYIKVRGFSSSPTTTQSIGDYTLYVNCFPPAPPTPPEPPPCSSFVTAPAEVEPNDMCAMASPSACCENHLNTLQVAGDVDYYAITLAAPARVTWETHADSSNQGFAVSDTKIWLYNSSCVEIANNDDGGVGLYSLLTQTLLPGTYYLEVSHWLRSGVGDYRLSIDCVTPLPLPPVQSAYAYTGTGCAGTGGTMTTALPRNEWAIIGTWFRIELYGSSGGPAVALIGAPITPIDLTMIGAPGCELSIDVWADLPGTVIGPNEQEMLLEVPLDAALVGFIVAQQWAELDAGANALGATFSDRLTLSVGEF